MYIIYVYSIYTCTSEPKLARREGPRRPLLRRGRSPIKTDTKSAAAAVSGGGGAAAVKETKKVTRRAYTRECTAEGSKNNDKRRARKKMRDTYLRLIPWPAMDVRIILDACISLTSLTLYLSPYLSLSHTLSLSFSIYLFESNLVALNSPDNHNKIIGYGAILQQYTYNNTHTHTHIYTYTYIYFI